MSLRRPFIRDVAAALLVGVEVGMTSTGLLRAHISRELQKAIALNEPHLDDPDGTDMLPMLPELSAERYLALPLPGTCCGGCRGLITYRNLVCSCSNGR